MPVRGTVSNSPTLIYRTLNLLSILSPFRIHLPFVLVRYPSIFYRRYQIAARAAGRPAGGHAANGSANAYCVAGRTPGHGLERTLHDGSQQNRVNTQVDTSLQPVLVIYYLLKLESYDRSM